MFCHQYPIEACAVRKTVPLGTLTGYEAFEIKVSLTRKGGSEIVRRPCERQHQVFGGRDGVVWSTEVNC